MASGKVCLVRRERERVQENYLHAVTRIEVSDIRALMETYGEDVWNYAYFLTKDAYLADDVAQETFVKAYRSFRTFRGESSVKNWLLKITRNTAFTMKRRAYLRRVILLGSRVAEDGSYTAGPSAPSAETEAVGREAADEIWRAVMALPGKFRDPFVLHLHHQLSMEEIASMLDLSMGTVKSRIFRAKKKVAEKLKGAHDHD